MGSLMTSEWEFKYPMVIVDALDRGVCDHTPLLLWLSKYHHHIWPYLVNIILYMVLLSKDHHPLVVPQPGTTVSSMTFPPLAIPLLVMAKPWNRLQTKRHWPAPPKRKTLVQRKRVSLRSPWTRSCYRRLLQYLSASYTQLLHLLHAWWQQIPDTLFIYCSLVHMHRTSALITPGCCCCPLLRHKQPVAVHGLDKCHVHDARVHPVHQAS
jgi:hypothetical protein